MARYKDCRYFGPVGNALFQMPGMDGDCKLIGYAVGYFQEACEKFQTK